jgi:hypothetical protein
MIKEEYICYENENGIVKFIYDEEKIVADLVSR